MQTFAKVVECNSFAKAAERLSISTSAASRNVAELEAHLGIRLLNRTTRRISLTEGGRAYFDRVIQLLAEIEETESLVASSNIVPRGTIRMTCSSSFGVPHLAPAIAEFQQQFPEVKFDISTSGRYVDLVEEGLDLAIRIGDIGNPNLTARKIGAMQMMVCASPSYLKQQGTPKHPNDLAGHNCVTYEYSTPSNLWRFHEPGAREGNGEIVVEVSGSVHADTGEMLAAVSASGAGIVLSPNFVVAPYIASGELVEILEPYRTTPYSIYAMFPTRRHLSAKVRTFVEFLATRFSGSSAVR